MTAISSINELADELERMTDDVRGARPKFAVSIERLSDFMVKHAIEIIAALRACETAREALCQICETAPEVPVIENPSTATAVIARVALAEIEKVMKP